MESGSQLRKEKKKSELTPCKQCNSAFYVFGSFVVVKNWVSYCSRTSFQLSTQSPICHGERGCEGDLWEITAAGPTKNKMTASLQERDWKGFQTFQAALWALFLHLSHVLFAWSVLIEKRKQINLHHRPVILLIASMTSWVESKREKDMREMIG